jgi:hypothetical protein
MGSLFGIKAPKQDFVFDDIPAPLTTRGGYLPLLQGKRRVAPVFCWAGNRTVSHSKVDVGGKGGTTAGSTDASTYYESGMQALVVGPAQKIYRITQNGEPILATTIDSTTYPSGSTITLAGEGSFNIYWGEIDQPVDSALATLSGVASRWPYVCYVFWNKKTLGASATWPSLEYEVEAVNDYSPSSALSGLSLELTGGINPLHLIDNILTAPYPHGCGVDYTQFDLTTLAGFDSALTAEDTGFSTIAEKGTSAQKVINSVLEDLGMMVTKKDGIVSFALIREDTPSLEITSDMWVRPLPTDEISLNTIQPTSAVFTYMSEDHAYSEVDIILGNDSATNIGYRKPEEASLDNVVNGTVAQVIASRREPEVLSSMHSINLNVTREARALRPGDLVTLTGNTVPLRIFETQIIAGTGRVKHSAYADLYSTASPVLTQTGPSQDVPQDDPDEDTFATFYELPVAYGSTSIAIVPLRIRANAQVKGAIIWLSANGTSYTQVGNDSATVAGGVLLEAISADDPSIIESGPTFTIDAVDSDTIQDLSSNEAGWRSGNQIAIINDELFYLRNVDGITSTTYRLEGLIRGRKGSEKQAHEIGDTVYILSPSELKPIASPLLIPGASISMKAQPYTEAKSVDLATVTAQTKTIQALYLKPSKVLNFRGNHSNSYASGDKIAFTWDYRVPDGQGTAAGEQLAGDIVGSVPDSKGTFLITITGGRTKTLAAGTRTWTYYNSDILEDFTTEQDTITATISEIYGSYQSTAVSIDITKNTETVAVDTTSPTPNPSTWSSEPIGTSWSTITMSANTATDDSGVEYYFECLENAAYDSGWQDSRIYLATGLLSNTVYSFRVKTRDKSTNQNETEYSSTVSAITTSINISDSPTFSDVVFSLDGTDTIWSAGTVLYQGSLIAIPASPAPITGKYVYWHAGDTAFLATDSLVTLFGSGNFPKAVNTGAAVLEIKEGFSLSTESFLPTESTSGAQSKADSAQSAAEATAAADATSKANTAETNAKNYADTNFVTTVTHSSDVSDLQSQIDGNITTWFYDGAPTLINDPAVGWTTTALKDAHLGDLYYDNVTGYAYRFRVVTGTYSWLQLSDSDIATALSAASTAQDTADSKRRVFVSEPTTPYEVGDLWDAGGSPRIIKRCSTERLTGAYNAADWTSIANYITNTNEVTDGAALGETAVWSSVSGAGKPDDNADVTGSNTSADTNAVGGTASATVLSNISTALSNASTAISNAATAQGTADGKVTTFVQTSAPTAEGTGDLWMDSDDGNKLYRWSGSAWAVVQDTAIGTALSNAATAQSTADGKIVSFYQTTAPTAEGVGDLWTDTDDSNKLYRWSGSAWVSVQDGTIATAATTATWSGVSGTGKPSDNADVTASNTAAAITGQGALATLSTVAANLIVAESLAAIQAVLGTVNSAYLTSSVLVGNIIKSAVSGRRLEMTSDGMILHSDYAAAGTVGTTANGGDNIVVGTSANGGSNAIVGTGQLARINNTNTGRPFEVVGLQDSIADFHFYDRITDASAGTVGDITMVNGVLRRCTSATPTWEDV